jgi:hypothetical protein
MSKRYAAPERHTRLANQVRAGCPVLVASLLDATHGQVAIVTLHTERLVAWETHQGSASILPALAPGGGRRDGVLRPVHP